MKSKNIRDTFLRFFRVKDHKIVDSAPMVLKSDPTLMFANAGMNQFKDYFLGNREPECRRVADTQKCLRVSGKHNDLEEVGLDSYHHTFFEMLGNWSFGDYFKEEAIRWSWELLVDEFGLDPERIYATVFEGSPDDNTTLDEEAQSHWLHYLPDERILTFGKGDNFWEMGDTGPCGPCSEIHYDLRSEKERSETPGANLVNKDHPLVIEIWNLVFMEFQRVTSGKLLPLPEKHVDTGMGFERLCMILQGKTSNYDTDIFQPFFDYLHNLTGITYSGSYDPAHKKDTAFRVVADHLRAVSFGIADGAMPANTGAGYVIRRILRRAVRYYYSFLGMEEPIMYGMVKILADQTRDVFPELDAQLDFVTKVVKTEEESFLKTLSDGLKRIAQMNLQEGELISGDTAFELYDTYGFPIDLTRLLAKEQGAEVDEVGFHRALDRQKKRSRKDAEKSTGDWFPLHDLSTDTKFVGYDQLTLENVRIVKYREVRHKDRNLYQIVFDRTPFYPEGGGQVGDQGVLVNQSETVSIVDTQKENQLIIHLADRLPSDPSAQFTAKVDRKRREDTARNHSATHLLHAALRKVLGEHVQQKGSLVAPGYLRFDFSHFQAVSDDELWRVEQMVNRQIMENITREEHRETPIEEAKKMGAMMLFGEKYDETVRVIAFNPDYSMELCGGCHVGATGEIGLFKVTQETSVAAGIRRIEAKTGDAAYKYVHDLEEQLAELKSLLKNTNDPVQAVQSLVQENKKLSKEIDSFKHQKASNLKNQLLSQTETVDDFELLLSKVEVPDSKTLKSLAHQLNDQLEKGVVVLAAELNGKAQMIIAINKELTGTKGFHAGNIIGELAGNFQGGGGGQAFFASAGGKQPSGLDQALLEAEKIFKGELS